MNFKNVIFFHKMQVQKLDDDLLPQYLKMFTSNEAKPWFVNHSKKIVVNKTKLFWWGKGAVSAVTNPLTPFSMSYRAWFENYFPRLRGMCINGDNSISELDTKQNLDGEANIKKLFTNLKNSLFLKQLAIRLWNISVFPVPTECSISEF